MKAKFKLLKTLLLVGLFTSVPMFYNSCSSDHKSSSGDFSSSLKTCDLTNYYSRTWYPFVKTNCATCHVAGGEGNGAFADANLTESYRIFNLKGFSLIGRYATDPGHKPPYTGTQHTAEVNTLSKKWADAEIEAAELCGDASLSDGRVKEDFSKWIRSKSKPIGATKIGDKKEIVWNLDTDLLPDNLPAEYKASGAKLKATIEVRDNLGEVYYTIYDPMLDMNGAKTDLRLQGIAFRINGVIIDNQTTFYQVDVTRYKNDRDNDTPVSSGAMFVFEPPRSTDVISLQIKSLENLDLGPQPDGANVQIVDADQTLSEGGTYEFSVQLSQAILTREVSVAIEDVENNKAVDKNTLQAIRDADGENIEVNRHDWDYQVLDRNLIFSPGETVKKFRVYIRPDDRYELTNEEKFQLRLGFVNGPAEKGNDTTMNVTIQDDDTQPSLDEVTYSDLVSPGGVFFDECIKCHNSVSLIGGYDITDYDQMLGADVVIPGNYMSSQMFIRVNGGTASFAKMPKDRDISFYQIDQIMKWIGGDGGNGDARND